MGSSVSFEMRAIRLGAFGSALAMLALAACGAVEPGVPSPATTSPVTTSSVTTSPVGSDRDALADTVWVASALSHPGSGAEVVPGSEPTIEFDLTGGAVSGSTGCNRYSARATIGRGALALDTISVTERACLDAAVMEQESAVLEILQTVTGFTIIDGVLTLEATAGSIDFITIEPVGDRPLDDTTWTLESFVRGETVSSVIATIRPMLVIDTTTQTVRGTTGCNDFFGSVLLDGTDVSFTDFTVTEIACEQQVMAQESKLLEILRAAVRLEIDGDRLRLATADGRALVYRAG